jgi:D-methionine transport system ATP-binding protein
MNAASSWLKSLAHVMPLMRKKVVASWRTDESERFELAERPGRQKKTSLDDASPSVAFEAVSKVFDTASGSVHALRRIDLSIARGEVFGFIGRSGAGKSTLIRLINCLERPTLGRVVVNGTDVGHLDEDGLVELRRRIGMIFQHFNLMSAKTVAENVGLPLVMAGVSRAAIDRKVNTLLELVGLSDKSNAYPAQLSGGQKQRVGIARALVHDPDILLCDEATSALDPETTQAILALLRDINRRLGITIILITHEMTVIREVCDRVAVLEGGSIMEHGAVWQVFGSPQQDITRSLLGQLNHGLPGDLAARLSPKHSGINAGLLIRTSFSGSGEAPDLLQLTQIIQKPVQLVASSIDRVRGRTFGELILAVATDGTDEDSLRQRLQMLGPGVTAEVLGYVANRL